MAGDQRIPGVKNACHEFATWLGSIWHRKETTVLFINSTRADVCMVGVLCSQEMMLRMTELEIKDEKVLQPHKKAYVAKTSVSGGLLLFGLKMPFFSKWIK